MLRQASTSSDARNLAGSSGWTNVSVQEPSAYYSYTPDNPGNVKAIVTAGAGVGKIGL